MSVTDEEAQAATQTQQKRRQGNFLHVVSKRLQGTSPGPHKVKSAVKSSPPTPSPPLSFTATTSTVAGNGPTEDPIGDDKRVTLVRSLSSSSSTFHPRSDSGNYHSRTSSGVRTLFGRFVHLITSSTGGKASQREDDGLRNEPYMDEVCCLPHVEKSEGSGQHSGVEDNLAHPLPLTTNKTVCRTPASGGTPCSAAEREEMEEVGMKGCENGEACYYYIEGSDGVYYIDPSALEDMELEEVGKGECEEGEQVQNQQRQEQLQLDMHRKVKGKAVKALTEEETKARRHLQKDCMIVLSDIGRTYRAMSRSVAMDGRDEKTSR